MGKGVCEGIGFRLVGVDGNNRAFLCNWYVLWMVLGGWSIECAKGGYFDTRCEKPIKVQ